MEIRSPEHTITGTITPERPLSTGSVSVVLVAYYADKWLPGCIETLASASSKQIHLLLVDNAGNTIIDSLDLSPFDCEVIKTPRPMGFAEANNYALTHAKRLEEIILFLNQDTLSSPGWLDACTTCMKETPHLGALSPLIRTYEWDGWDVDFLAFVARSGQSGQLDLLDESAETWFEVEDAPAPSLLVRTDVLEKIGPFDPIYGSYYEDMDLCLRIRRIGLSIGFHTSAKIAHYNGSATTTREKELKRARQIIRNQVIYKLRQKGQVRLPLVLKMVFKEFPGRLLRGLRGTASSKPPSVVLKAYWDLSKIAHRLISAQADNDAWTKYLSDLGWPDSIPGFNIERQVQSESASAV